MKTLITKLTILVSVILLIGMSSCVEVEYVDCADAQIEIVNNTDYDVFFANDPLYPDYCDIDNWLAPGESVIIFYGEVHARADEPPYYQFLYTFDVPGTADHGMDIAIDVCSSVVYLQ